MYKQESKLKRQFPKIKSSLKSHLVQLKISNRDITKVSQWIIDNRKESLRLEWSNEDFELSDNLREENYEIISNALQKNGIPQTEEHINQVGTNLTKQLDRKIVWKKPEDIILPVIELGDASEYEFIYENHGDKHFKGNTKDGSQFNENRFEVNPILEEHIKKNWDKIQNLLIGGEKSIIVYIGGTDKEASGYRFVGDKTDHFNIQTTVDEENKTVHYHGYPMDPIGKDGVGRSQKTIN